MKELTISKRLSTAASYVRDGAVIADIGTDHAYIPIYLTQIGKASKAIATDINEGPILRAKENISAFGYQDKIEAYIADGLDSIADKSPNDIFICGMGGELIAEIIDKCEYVKNKDISLILQPMTSILELRTYLKKGFLIYDEDVVFEDGKYYQIICARYDGKNHRYNEVELEIGKINIKKRTGTFLNMLDFLISKKKKIKQGLEKGACDTGEISRLIEKLEALK